jgi:hypothetical protein
MIQHHFIALRKSQIASIIAMDIVWLIMQELRAGSPISKKHLSLLFLLRTYEGSFLYRETLDNR